jgi:hypothetical protein
MNTSKESFIGTLSEKQKIDTKALECIRTYDWGDKAVLRIEYSGFHKDYKPANWANENLLEKYGCFPGNLNFNNIHYDRISCSVLNVYGVQG